MANQLILGVDPGSRITGYAILEQEGRRYRALRCDVIRLHDLEDHAQRLLKLFNVLSDIVCSFQPAECVVETPVFGKDPQAMLKLGRAQAACILAFNTNGYNVTEYLPKEVKKSVTGNGNASKQQVASMLAQLVSLPDEKLKNDATDALAVAWCHAMRQKFNLPVTNHRHKNNQKDPWMRYLEENPDKMKGKL